MQTFLLIGTTPIGGPVLGWVADTFGARTPIFIGGVACLAAAAWGLAARRGALRRAEDGGPAAAGAN